MKKLLIFIALIGICCVTNAQSVKQKNTPNGGSFFIKTTTAKGTEYVNVNYTLYPAPFTNVLRFNLRTANDFAMSVKVTDLSGKVILSWTPSSTSYQYDSQLDISGLKNGTYHFNIYGSNNTKVQSVPFVKS